MAGPARKILLGQVIGTKMAKTAKVRVNRLQLDPFVTQYFPKKSTVFAHDPEEEAKLGDIVLVKELPVRKAKNVLYQMERVIYSLGNVTDPITGKKCDGYSYWEDAADSDKDGTAARTDGADVGGSGGPGIAGEGVKVDGTPL